MISNTNNLNQKSYYKNLIVLINREPPALKQFFTTASSNQTDS